MMGDGKGDLGEGGETGGLGEAGGKGALGGGGGKGGISPMAMAGNLLRNVRRVRVSAVVSSARSLGIPRGWLPSELPGPADLVQALPR